MRREEIPTAQPIQATAPLAPSRAPTPAPEPAGGAPGWVYLLAGGGFALAAASVVVLVVVLRKRQ